MTARTLESRRGSRAVVLLLAGTFLAGAILTSACDSPQSDAQARAGVLASTFWQSVQALGTPTEADLQRLAKQRQGVAVLASGANPWRGGRSVLLTFVGRTTHLGKSVRETLCFRADLTGRPVTAGDWNQHTSACDAQTPIAPELPDGVTSKAATALRSLTPKQGSTRGAVEDALKHVLPQGIQTTVAAGTINNDITAPTYGYSGGPAVAVSAGGGADCLLVWSWATGYIVWHPQIWDYCVQRSGPLALEAGAVPVPSAPNQVVAGRRG